MVKDNYILSTDRLSKSFDAFKAVSGITIKIEAGKLHSIIGPNGAGKTTLFNLLTKDLSPSSGKIFFRDIDITDFPPYKISRLGIGRSYQITSVFQNQSVYDNVWIAVYQHHGPGSYNFWKRSQSLSGLHIITMDYIELVGLTTFAPQPAKTLSYGDQRLLEIAITLASSPELLLFDEPTNGLSQNETKTLAELIKSLVPKFTVLMIEHKVDVVMNISDVVSVMNFGEFIFTGSPAEVQNSVEVKKAYFGI